MNYLLRRLSLCVIVAIMSAQVAFAVQSGDADPGFGTNGITLVDFTPVAGAPGMSYLAASAVDAQGRTWAAASVIGSNNAGLGLTRLTRTGQLDTSFGTGGLVFVPAPALSSYSLIGLRIGLDGRVYVAYSEGSTTFVTWHVCRIAANGSFDTAFFGGCAGAAPATGAVAHDLQISPLDGSPWLIGSAVDSDTNLKAPAIAKFDLSFDIVRTQTFSQTGANVDAIAGAFNFSGAFFFTGSYTTTNANANADAVIGFIGENGTDFSYQFLNIVPFDVGGSLNDVGRCIALTPDLDVVIGVSVDSGFDGVHWGSAKVLSSSNFNLDPNYGTGGKQHHLIGDPELGRSASNYAINACGLSTDGGLNMIGSYYFTDPGPNASAQAATLYRLLPDGTPDANFGGPFATPGVFYTLTYPGAVLDYLHPATDPRPRYDSLSTVTSKVPNTGSIVVGGVSRRSDGTSNGDLAVMRVVEDDIFNANNE